MFRRMKKTVEIFEHVINRCQLTTSTPPSTGLVPIAPGYKEKKTTLKAPQATIIHSPKIPGSTATVTLRANHFTQTLTVSVLLSNTLALANTAPVRMARQIKIYNPEAIEITFTQISARAGITQDIIVTATVVQALAADQISVEIEGRTSAERALARDLVSLPGNGVFSVTIVNIVTLSAATMTMTTARQTLKYDNRHYRFERDRPLTLALPGDKKITIVNDFNGEYLTSLAAKHTLHIYGVNFNHTLASLVDNTYLTTVRGENNVAVTLTTYSPRQPSGATLLYDATETQISTTVMEEITTEIILMTTNGMTTTMTMTITSSTSTNTVTLTRQEIIAQKNIYKNEAADNDGKTIYLLSTTKIAIAQLTGAEKFDNSLINPKFIILQRYTSGASDRFIRLTNTFFRRHDSPATTQFRKKSVNECINNDDAKTPIGTSAAPKYFYLDKTFNELSGVDSIFPPHDRDKVENKYYALTTITTIIISSE